MDELIQEMGVQHKWTVGIEDFLLGYRGFNYRTQDLFALAQLNSVVTYDCMNKVFSITGVYIS